MAIHNSSALPTAATLSCFATPPRRVIFQPGESLFRFGTIVSSTRDSSQIFSSPWWIPQNTYRDITKIAHGTGQSINDVARSRLSVSTAWNKRVDWLWIFELQKPVYAWIGPAKPQPKDDDLSVMYLGNLDQAYIPGLAPEHATTSGAGRLAYCGWLTEPSA